MICKQAELEMIAYSGLLQHLSIPREVWRDITMDFIKGLPKLEDKDIILVVVYWFIKYGHFIFM